MNTDAHSPVWWRLLAAVTLVRFALVIAVPISPEEAYHWTYAKHLDWGYFDHPPMIAWAIAAGCALFGHSAAAVRIVPLLLGTGTCAALAHLAHRLYGARAAAFAVLLFSVQPAAFAIGVAGFPDSPLLFFWALTLVFVVRALDGGSGAWWLAAGAALGAAMLSKYTAVFLAVGVLIHLALSNRDRRWLASPWPYAGALAAAVVFAPVLLWNAQHDWASLHFQSVNRLEEANPVSAFRGLKAFLQQWLVIVPLTLPLVAAGVVHAARSSRPEERLLLWAFVPGAIFFLAIGFTLAAHALWPLPAYLGLTVVMAGMMDAGAGAFARFYERRSAWLAAASASVVAVCAAHVVFFLPVLSPVRSLYGWGDAADRARSLHARLAADSVYIGAGRKYTVASQLAFHLAAPDLVHGKHVIGGDGMQFTYWTDGGDLDGRDAVVVACDQYAKDAHAERAFEERLREYFRSVERAGALEVPVGRVTLLPSPPVRFVFYIGRGYRSTALKQRQAPLGAKEEGR